MWHFGITEWAFNSFKALRGHARMNKNRNDRSNIFRHMKWEKGTKIAVLVFLSAIAEPGAPLPTLHTSGRLTAELDKLHRTGNFTDMLTHATLSDEVLVSVSATSHGIRSTSEAGQLYSYCILNYQDSGFYRTLAFLRDLSVLFTKRMKRIQSITLCTYGH